MSDKQSANRQPLKRFPRQMTISFNDSGLKRELVYELVGWDGDSAERTLRHGDNPGQDAALYRLINGNLAIGEVSSIAPGNYLASLPELLQRGKHPSKGSIVDADAALNILRYLMDEPTCAITKHGNPCGVAVAESLPAAYTRAYLADRLAAVGGCVALNRAVDATTAEAILESGAAVIVAPEYEAGVVGLLAENKNLIVLRIGNMDKLSLWAGRRMIDFKALIDGGLIAQWSFVPDTLTRKACRTATAIAQGKEVSSRRRPNGEEWDDMLLAWKIATGVTSNTILFVKEGVTVGIGIGGQDRLSAVETTRDKAYRKIADRLAWDRFKTPFHYMVDPDMRESIWSDASELKGGLIGAVMASDGVLPHRDVIDEAAKEGVVGVIQPGGDPGDYAVIRAANEYNMAVIFTGQRCFQY